MEQAVAAAKQKDIASARASLRQLLKQEPNSLDVLAQWTCLSKQCGHWDNDFAPRCDLTDYHSGTGARVSRTASS